MKLIKTIIISLTAGLILANSSYSLVVETDPHDNAGTPYFKDIVNKSGSKDIVPNIIYPFLPSGSVLKNILATDARNAPDIGAVEAIVVFLAQAFAGKGSDTGLWLWRIAMMGIIAGLLLSGFLTFQAVSQGKKGISEGLVGFVTKVIISIVLFTFVVPNVPTTLIGISNVITDQIDDWYIGGNPGTGGTGSLQTLEAIFTMKMVAAQAAAATTAAAVTSTAAGGLRDQRKDALIRAIDNDPIIKKNTDKDFTDEWKQVQALFNKVTATGRKQASGESIKGVNELIDELANIQPTIVMQQITKLVENQVGAVSASGASSNPTAAGDEELKNQMAKAPQSIDYSKFTYPTRLVQTYAYIAFVYLSISIWGMGFGAIIWTMIYSFPEEWNLGNLLVSGFKASIGVVLGIILVAIYLTGGVHHSNVEATKVAASTMDGFRSFLGAIPGGSIATLGWDIGAGVAGIWSNPGSAAVNFLSGVTGMTPDQFIIGMLIMTAPAQAALLVKGGNGIAESAKNALHNQGSSSGSIGSMMGNWGGSSGVNSSGGAGFSSAGIIANRSDDIRAGFSPGRRP